MKNLPIPEIVLFAYATKGEALEVANATSNKTCVAAVHILRGLAPAKTSCAYVVLPANFNKYLQRSTT